MDYQLLKKKRFSSAILFTMIAIALLSLTAKASAQTVGAVSDADGVAGGMVAENSSTGTEVGITAQAANAVSYTLIDSAGDALTDSDRSLFAIDAQSGTVTVAIAMLDHEAFSTHSITVRASNSASSQTMSFVIRVTDVPEPLRFIADTDLRPNRIGYGSMPGDEVGIAARAVDPDRGSMVSYSLSEDSTGLFTIGVQSGIVTLASGNYEHDPEQDYPIEVTAMSNDGTSSSAQFTVRPDELLRIAPSPTASTVEEGESQAITFSTNETKLKAKAVSVYFHACAIGVDNRVVCWGDNANGKATPPPGEFIAISAGKDHTCAIAADNDAVCWGSNADGRATPTTDGKFIAIAAGENHTCAITTDNDAACWGRNTNIVDRVIGQATPPEGRKFIAIGAGGQHTCAITTDNDAVCWGANSDGQSAPPAGRKYIAIAAGGRHTCAITTDNDAV